MSNYKIYKDNYGININNSETIQTNKVRLDCLYFTDGSIMCTAMSTGPTGAASNVTGPTGMTGPTGPSSNVTGPTGPLNTLIQFI